MNPTIQIIGQQVSLSDASIKSFIKHDNFTLKGIDWLILNDPKGVLEYELLDSIKFNIEDDFSRSILHLQQNQQDSLKEEFLELSIDDWWVSLELSVIQWSLNQ